jgi:predicted nucleotidyltransferase
MSWSKIGVSGSLLIKLHMHDSDIDPIVYGTENCLKVYEALKCLTKNSASNIKAYSPEELQKLHEFRVKDTKTSFEDFAKTETRKVLQGKFKGRDYFMRFVKDWEEINEEYGTVQYRSVGHAKIRGDIGDESESIFTPCRYKLERIETLEGTSIGSIEEIVSFRGRFCEQARIGETVIAQGKVEKVIDKNQNREYFRLLIGNKPSDFMILA